MSGISYFDAAKIRYPNLKNLKTDLGRYHRQCRMKVLQFDYYGRQLSPEICSTAPELLRHFASRAQAPKTGSKRVYLMEDLQADFIEVVAHFFGLNLFLFGTQIRSTFWEATGWKNNNTPNLPSAREIDGIFTLWYFEAFELKQFYDYYEKLNVGRRATFSNLKMFEALRLARRRASFWSRQDPDDGGWDVLMLLDPPIKINKPGQPCSQIQLMQHQGGYTDFTPWSIALAEIAHSKPGPPRTSALDDLAYYIELTFANCKGPPTPEMPALLLRRLVLSHYMLLVEIVKAITSHLENESRRFQSLSWFEENMMELFDWNRRLSEYCNSVEAAKDDS